MEPQPRSGAMPPHAVWPRPQGAMHGFGGIRHSLLGMTKLQSCFCAAKRRAMRPGAAWLGRYTRFFGQDQRNGVAKGFYKGLPLFRPAALLAALCPRPPAGLHTQCGRLIYTYLHAQAALARLARLAAVFEPAVPADGDNIAGMHLRRAAAGGQGVDEHELALKKPLRLGQG